jgi:hypothetical protein
MQRRVAPILTFTVGLLLFSGLAYALQRKKRAKPSLPKVFRDEKREQSRLDFYAQALVRKPGTECEIDGEITNISDLGVYLRTYGQFSIDDLLDLTIYFQHGTKKLSITVPCKVVRVDGNGIGLTSAHIETNELQELELIFYVNIENTNQLMEEFIKAI